MKRILVLVLSAALVLSGCNKIDHLAGDPSLTPSAVSFSTYLGTKGLEKTTFKMGDQFFTYGVKTGNDNFNIATPAFTEYVFTGKEPLLNGLTVTHMGSDGDQDLWEYDEVAPWDNQKATFFAVSPVPQGEVTHGITLKPIADNAIPAIDFNVVGGYAADATQAQILAASEKIKDQADLMWAYSPDNVKTGGSIQMSFQHALSQLSFAVKAYHTSGFLRINSITLKNVKTKGTLALAHTDAQKGAMDYLGGWSTATIPMDFAVNLLTENVGALSPFKTEVGLEPIQIPITDNDEALMMIPQVMTGITLEVKYSHSDDGINWTNYKDGESLDYEFSKLSSHWNPNKRYNYCLNINPGMAIVFKSSIEEWDPINSQLDMEYRTFDAKATPHLLTVAGGTEAPFPMGIDDKISVEYIYDAAVVKGHEWITYTTSATGATAKLLSKATPVTVADAGDWKLGVEKNFYPFVRKAVVTVNRAPFKKTINGVDKLFSGGVAKFIVTQDAGEALAPTSVLYGGQNATVLTNFTGFTTTSYPNAIGTTAYPTTDAAILGVDGEPPYGRFRVAKSAPAGAAALANIFTTCADYSEEGMLVGRWRLPRAAEMRLIHLNRATIDKVLTVPLPTTSYFWSSTSNTTAGSLIVVQASAGGGFSNGSTGSYFIRCIAEE